LVDWRQGRRDHSVRYEGKERGKFSGRGLPKEQFTPPGLMTESEKIERLAKDVKDFFSTHFPEPVEDA
jgi:hypothetical protein